MENTQEKISSGELGRAESEGDSDNKDNMAQCPAGVKPAGAPSGAPVATSENVEADVAEECEPEESAARITDPDDIIADPKARRLFQTEYKKYECQEKFAEAVRYVWKLGTTPICIYRLASENNSFCNAFPELLREIKNLIEIIEAEPVASFYTAAELSRHEMAPVSWIVEQFISEGLTLLVGKPKVGKSWMVLHLCLTLASGGLLFGKYRTTKCRVLYLALEDGPRRLKSRMHHLSDSDFPEDLIFMNKLPHSDYKLNLEFIGEFLDRYPDCKTVVIDTLAKIRPSDRKAGSNIYQQDSEFLGPLQRLALVRHVAIILVHHDRKLAAKDVFETISGSNGLFGAADTALVVTGDRNSSERVLHVTGRDIAERQITMKFEDGIWEFVSDGKRNLISPERKIIVDALGEFGPMTPTQLAEKLNKKRPGVNRLMIALKGTGILAQNEKDEYMIKEDNAVILEAADAALGTEIPAA